MIRKKRANERETTLRAFRSNWTNEQIAAQCICSERAYYLAIEKVKSHERDEIYVYVDVKSNKITWAFTKDVRPVLGFR